MATKTIFNKIKILPVDISRNIYSYDSTYRIHFKREVITIIKVESNKSRVMDELFDISLTHYKSVDENFTIRNFIEPRVNSGILPCIIKGQKFGSSFWSPYILFIQNILNNLLMRRERIKERRANTMDTQFLLDDYDGIIVPIQEDNIFDELGHDYYDLEDYEDF